MDARLEFLYLHLSVTFVEDVRAGDTPQVIVALKANNVLEAIKLYRITDASLEQAKLAIQEMRTRLGI